MLNFSYLQNTCFHFVVIVNQAHRITHTSHTQFALIRLSTFASKERNKALCIRKWKLKNMRPFIDWLFAPTMEQGTQPTSAQGAPVLLLVWLGLGMKWNSKQLFIVGLAAAQQQINIHDSCTPVFLTRNTQLIRGFFRWFYLWPRRRNIVGILSKCCELVEFNCNRTLIWFKRNLQGKIKFSHIHQDFVLVHLICTLYMQHQNIRRFGKRKRKRDKASEYTLYGME